MDFEQASTHLLLNVQAITLAGEMVRADIAHRGNIGERTALAYDLHASMLESACFTYHEIRNATILDECQLKIARSNAYAIDLCIEAVQAMRIILAAFKEQIAETVQ